jgi:type II secretory pathway pseudopilin PulG
MRAMRKRKGGTVAGIQYGFTVMEMAIVCILVGLVLAAISPLYGQYLRKQRIEKTELALTEIKDAIGSFRTINGRYPCPASLTEERNETNYGREACDNENPGLDNNFNTLPGNCVAGICIESSIRATPVTFINPLTDMPVTAIPRVRVGFVPFRNINIDEDKAYDGYGSRILYVVTENLAYSKSFTAGGGGIELRNELGNSVINAPGTAHFLILSAGENEVGAYKESDVRIGCPQGSLESENCSPAISSIYLASQISNTGNPASHYDDVLSYFTQHEIPLWQYSSAPLASDHIHQKPGGEVGFGIDSVLPVQKRGHVSGKIRAQDDPGTPAVAEGRFLLEEICDAGGTNCFRPEVIDGVIGTGGDIVCPPGEFVYAIANSQAQCVSEVVLKCPKDKFMTGISGGTILCGDPPPPPGCPKKDVEVCTKPFRLPFGQPGDIREIGDCYGKQTFACIEQEWTPVGPPPVCGCTDGSNTITVPCPFGYEGSGRVVTTTIQCDPCNVKTETTVDECVCVGATDTRTDSCPDGHTGNGISMEREWRCTPPPGRWGPWKEKSRDCKCSAEERTLNEPCPPGMKGGPIVIKERFNCTTLKWDELSRDQSSCKADVCRWNEGFSQGVFPTPSGSPAGAPCPCGTPDANCYANAGAGYTHFSQCTCD